MAEAQGSGSPSVRWKGMVQLAVVLAVVVVALYFMRAPGITELDVVVAKGTADAPRVSVVQPSQTTHTLTVTLTGEVRLHTRIAMTSEVRGRVMSVSPKLRNGGTFRAGETLLALDPREIEINVREAQAGVEEALARVRKHELKGQLERAKFLRDNPGQEVPAIVAHEPQIERFKARVKHWEAVVADRELNLSKTKYSLPFDGRIITTNVGIGEVVGPANPFGIAYSKEAIGIEAPISLVDLAHLGDVVGRDASARLAGRTLPAVVERSSSVVAPRSRMATLFFAFADSVAIDELPLPGTFVQVSVEGAEYDNAFRLPEAAEQHDGSVWVIDGDELRSVTADTLGRMNTGWIVAAFDAGDGVVVGAVPGAAPGLKVEAVAVADAGDA
ncbi:MAG: hypothetical protein F4X98_05410 [Gammaproteobacteria bacterium]|nr:hypothetical protein [Gammaproteobacteria bacterium]